LAEVQKGLSNPQTEEPVRCHQGASLGLERQKLTLQYVVVTPEDYILGMSDLTGELMRYATNGSCPAIMFCDESS
jgi:hypothetical protein